MLEAWWWVKLLAWGYLGWGSLGWGRLGLWCLVRMRVLSRDLRIAPLKPLIVILTLMDRICDIVMDRICDIVM